MALPVALFAMLAATALASAAVISSIDVQQGSHRDSASKQAIAAADAGAGVALERLNRYASVLNNAANSNCLGVSAEGTLVVTGAVNGWCPAVEGAVGGATYSYQVSAMFAGSTMNVVSTGTVNGTSRRVDVAVTAESIDDTLKEEGLIGKDNIELPGTPNIRVNVGTNGNIDTAGHSHSWEICGNARHGSGKDGPTDEELSCEGEAVERNIELPSVDSFIPENIESENSDYRLEDCIHKNEPSGCELDSFSGNGSWDPETRSIKLSGHSTLTLGGEDYWLCQLTITGSSHLIMSNEAHARLFFDTPEHCGLSGPQITVTGSSNIEATGNEPQLGSFDVVGLYLLGGVGSTVSLGGSSGTNDIMLYAPDTAISMSGHATYTGVIAGETLKINGSPTFEQDEGFEPEKIGSTTLYSRQSYVECSGGGINAGTAPDASC